MTGAISITVTLPERLLGALPPRSTMALITTPNLQSPSLQVPRDTTVAAENTSSTARVQNTQEWLDSIVTGCDAVQVHARLTIPRAGSLRA